MEREYRTGHDSTNTAATRWTRVRIPASPPHFMKENLWFDGLTTGQFSLMNSLSGKVSLQTGEACLRDNNLNTTTTRWTLRLHDRLEPAVAHFLGVKRHLLHKLRIVHRWIAHHFLVDAVAVLARFEDNEREHDSLPGLELQEFLKGDSKGVFQIIAEALFVIERAVLHPCFFAQLGHLAVQLHVLLRERDQESIDVGHGRMGKVRR